MAIGISVESLIAKAGFADLDENSQPSAVGACLARLDDAVQQERRLTPLDLQVLRETVLTQIRPIVSTAAAMYDAALQATRATGEGQAKQGRALTLTSPEPWPQPVSLASFSTRSRTFCPAA